jgi:hypothetical protein
MKKYTFLFLLLLLTIHLSAQKDKAEAFALKVAKSIIEKDCDNFNSFFADTIVLLQKKQFLVKDSISKKLIGLCQHAIKSDSVNYKYYLENFERQLFDSKEMRSKLDPGFSAVIDANPYYKLQANDYLFMGFKHKTGNYNDYLLNDPFCIIFRQVGNDFKILVFADN